MRDGFTGALAMVLEQETGYRQPIGGPYIRTENGHVLDDATGKLRARDGTLMDLPAKPDRMAFDDDPHDTGGRTGMGILQREYDAWRKQRGLDLRDVWRIADAELTAIYRQQFWDTCRCGELEPGTAEMTFNTATNAGVGTAARQLQSVTGVTVDGHIGAVTIDAANAMRAKEVVHKLAALQDARYRRLPTFWRFGTNWTTRNRCVETWCAARAQDIDPWHPEVVASIEDIRADGPTERAPRATTAPPTVIGSTTNQAAIGQGLAGGSVLPLTVLQKASTAVQAGKSIMSVGFVLDLLADPIVWGAVCVSVAMVGGAVHIIRERVQKMMEHGV